MKKRKDGLYPSQVYLGLENGKRKYKTVYGKTQKEVKEKAAQLKMQLGRGVDISAAEDTFKVWADRHQKLVEQSGVSYSSIQGLKTNIAHLKTLHGCKLSHISVAQIQDVINEFADWHDGKPPMSKRSLNSLKQVARDVFRRAIVARVVEFNPADYVTIPKNAPETHREALTDKQRRWVTETPHEGQIAAMLMLYAGLRRGELLALMWSDINLRDGTIAIDKAVEYKNGKPSLKSTKTEAGCRIVKIPTVLAEFLGAHKENAVTIRIISKNGEIPKLTVWRNYWKRYMQHLNLMYGYGGKAEGVSVRDLEMRIDTFTPHQLRHTFATLLYQAGVDVLTAKDQMGHTDIKTTLGIYTHLDKQYKKSSMSRLDDYLSKYNASNEDENNVAITL